MKYQREQRQLRTNGYRYGTKNSSSHWLFQNWLCFGLKSVNMTLQVNMVLVAKPVCLYQSSELGFELSLYMIEREEDWKMQGFLWDFNLLNIKTSLIQVCTCICTCICICELKIVSWYIKSVNHEVPFPYDFNFQRRDMKTRKSCREICM